MSHHLTSVLRFKLLEIRLAWLYIQLNLHSHDPPHAKLAAMKYPPTICHAHISHSDQRRLSISVKLDCMDGFTAEVKCRWVPTLAVADRASGIETRQVQKHTGRTGSIIRVLSVQCTVVDK